MDDRPADRWSIAILRGAGEPLRSIADARPFSTFTRDDIGPSADFVADPFLLHHDGTWHLFFEVLDHDSGLGQIGLATSADARAWRYEGIVLREPFHLSYPHVFAHGGEIFMTPETLGAEAVRLYRADPFPDRWTLVADLIPGTLADPTPFFAQGRWWLFACPRPHEYDALTLYTAETLTGPWREHPRSPLRENDPRTARPAGRVLIDGDRIVRMAQDCVPHYGTAVRAFVVNSLTTEEYAETPFAPEPILRAGSGWNGLGMHHLDAQPLPDGHWIAAVDGHFSPS